MYPNKNRLSLQLLVYIMCAINLFNKFSLYVSIMYSNQRYHVEHKYITKYISRNYLFQLRISFCNLYISSSDSIFLSC